MNDPGGLMTIGDFARATGLTPKALRLYDDLGLLPPAEVDRHSGYRRYAGSQVEHARLVASLRLLGMPLARIAEVVDRTGADAAREIESYWAQVESDTATRRQIVATLVEHLTHEEPIMTTPTRTLHVEIGASARQGRRRRMLDAWLATADLVAVADGYGERDDLADVVLRAFADGGLDAAVAEVAREAAAALPAPPASGTTLTAVAIDGSTARIIHVGDGRAWLVREGEVRRLTHDHTVVAALLEAGQLSVEEVRSHEHRNILNRALTPGAVVDESTVDLRPGDRLVLTTDGVHSWVDDLHIVLVTKASPQEVADEVAAAVAEAGEPDNHTIVVADLS